MEDNIHEVATETVCHVRKQERQLVAALYALCGAGEDEEALSERQKALSEQVRRLEDACQAADKLLDNVTDGSGPAAFLLRRRPTVDVMTSLMTSPPTWNNVPSDWPTVRFEAYGLDSSLVGRLIVNDQDSERRRGSYTDAEWAEVTLSDVGVRTDYELRRHQPATMSRCEASGSCGDRHVTSGARREHISSLSDASTSTTAVNVVSSSTSTDQPVTRHQSTYTELPSSVISRVQQTNTETDVRHCATSTDQPQTCSVGVTAALLTDQTSSQDADKVSTWTCSVPPRSVDELTVTSVQTSHSAVDASNSLTAEDSTTVPPLLRLVALLPEIERTADVLAASRSLSALTARLLRQVDLQMTPSGSVPDRHDVTADDQRRHVWTQTCTDVVDRQSAVLTSNASTLTDATPTTFDKETSTTRTYQVNKSVATDCQSTADKQTSMPSEVASAYLACTGVTTRRLLSVSRGTSTPSSFIRDWPSPDLSDRATSPVRVELVDKSVMASKAEALEPLDTFQAAGQLSAGPMSPRTRRTSSLSPRSKLACISEGVEHCEEEDFEDTSHLSQLQQLSPSQPATTTTRLQQQLTQVCDVSGNVFNFDHAVTSRFADHHTTMTSRYDDVFDS